MLELLQLGIDSLSFVLSIDYFKEFLISTMLIIVVVSVINFIKGWCYSL